MNENHESSFLRSLQELKAYFEKKRSRLKNGAAIGEALDELLNSMQDLRAASEDLERLEPSTEPLPANVLPFRRPRPSTFQQVDDRRWILRLDCLIETPHLSEAHKMALELHSHSKRYAFLEFEDLDASTRVNPEALRALGAITLFLPNFAQLSAAEQAALHALVNEDSLQRPLLMAASTIPYAELRLEPGLNLDLLAMLARAYIKLGRPVSEYKREGLFHYFLDSLSESPT